MLRELSIENLAVIEKASITFGDKMNVFTGETGAGKSILIGGINAILGGRVSKDIVRFGAEKAVVVGLFDDIPEKVNETLANYGFTAEDELLLQREITADGKSVARINGRTVTVAALKEIASELINIHGQHDNQLLMSSDKQREILDNYAELGDLLNEYKTAFKEFSAISRKIKEVSDASARQSERADILSERLAEIDEYKFQADEEETVNKKIDELRNFEYIEDNLYGAAQAISGDDEETGAYTLLQRVRSNVSSLCDIIPEFSDVEKRVSDMLIELEDIRAEISSKLSGDNDDAAKLLSKYEERLSDILRAKRKFKMDIPELIETAEEWRQELYMINNIEDILEKLAEQKRETGERLKKLGVELTNRRKEAADELAKRIAEELTFLDMPDIRLIFDIRQDKVTLSGMDVVEMLISVNKGEELEPMSKIASGGELSRI
ncbi:MAG: AAA family ATPase, partial [Ruminiclostridium sp.]|nr:AAA family ATPase [Ruminiclostridium sp.]